MTSNWETVRLGDIFQLSNSRLGEHEDEPPVFAISKYDGVVLGSDYHDKRVASAKLDTYKVVDADAWAYSTIHIDEGSIARNKHGFSGVVSPMYTIMNWTSSNQDPSYFELLLRSPNMLTIYGDFAQGSINRRRSLPWKTFSELQVPVPSLAEQRRIVDLMDALDDAVEAADESCAAAQAAGREYRRWMVAPAYSGSTTPLGSVATSRLGKMLSATTSTASPSAPYLRNANVQWNSIGLEDLKEMPFSEADRSEFELLAGDVLICEGGEIGRSAVLDRDLPGVFFQKALHRVRCGGTLLPGYLQMCMEQMAEDGTLELFSGGSTIPHLTGEKLRKLPIPVTPLEQQAYAVDTMSSLKETTSSFAEYACSLRALRTELLTSLLSGAHTIPESYDELLDTVDA